MAPTTEDLERAERMLRTLSELNHLNSLMPIIVEGRKDVRALRELGFKGELITLNKGKGLYEFCEEILQQYSQAVLLMDWDSSGERIFKALSNHLSGLWEAQGSLRESLKMQCQKDIRDIEAIPSLLYNLLGRKITLQDYETLEKLKGNR